MSAEELIITINHAWDKRHEDLSFTKDAINEILNLLDKGTIRIAEKTTNNWKVNEWIKKAILLSFKLYNSNFIEDQPFNFYDKIPLKFNEWKEKDFLDAQIRAVPGSIVRKSAYIAQNVILMPSFVNVGAFIDSGTLIDTWSTVGSCAQIGKNCHISGGVGIGGVLEPIQANPVIIEDNCFIGARSEIAEGVIIGEGAVLSMGVFIGQSTKIFNRATGEISYGKVPPYSVVVPGNLPSKDGTHSLYAAIIVKQVDQQTRNKTSINDLLRS